MANAAIGSRISLISKSEIRYEGFLDHINTQENHVGLKNVRMFGTEGRKGGAGEVPASDNLYEFIIFRGGDIKDLSVFENQPRDPAIVNSKPSDKPASSQPEMRNNNNNNNGGGSAWSRGPPSGLRTANDNNNNDNNNNNRRYNNNNNGGDRYHNNNNNNYRGGGRGGYRGGNNNNNSRPVTHTGQDFQVASDPQRAQQQVGTDFDFGKAQKEFEQAKQNAHAAREAANANSKKYDKKDFFDTLKPEDKTKTPGQNGNFQARRMEREVQQQVDSDTFGSDMVAAQNSRGFGRGRGRGGRGGGRGYRGGNNNNNNGRGGNGSYRGGQN